VTSFVVGFAYSLPFWKICKICAY